MTTTAQLKPNQVRCPRCKRRITLKLPSAAALMGAAGTGDSKRRGGPDYYRTLRAKGIAKAKKSEENKTP